MQMMYPKYEWYNSNVWFNLYMVIGTCMNKNRIVLYCNMNTNYVFDGI